MASVAEWGKVAQNLGDYIDPISSLEEQVRVWRDLLVTGRDPLSLVPPRRLESVARDPRPIIKAFAWELAAAMALAAGLALLLTFASHWVKSVFGTLAVVGISASAVVSWIKARAQSVANRVGSAVDQSVIDDAVTMTPKSVKKTWRDRYLLPLDHPS